MRRRKLVAQHLRPFASENESEFIAQCNREYQNNSNNIELVPCCSLQFLCDFFLFAYCGCVRVLCSRCECITNSGILYINLYNRKATQIPTHLLHGLISTSDNNGIRVTLDIDGCSFVVICRSCVVHRSTATSFENCTRFVFDWIVCLCVLLNRIFEKSAPRRREK